jgi:ABC-type sugar transport system substrate-binding protein
MKKAKIVIALLLSLILLLSLLGCGKDSSSGKGPKDDGTSQEQQDAAPGANAGKEESNADSEEAAAVKPKNGERFVIGYTASAYAIAPWAHSLGDNIQKICDENGWEFIMLAAEADMSLQAEHVTNLVLQDCDVIVLLAGDTAAAVTWAQEIYDANIPAIFVAADVNDEGKQYAYAYVGPDQYQFSAELAQYIVDKHGADAGLTVCSINAVPEQYDFVQRELGFKSVMDKTNYNYIGPEYAYVDRSLAVQIMENYISTYGDDIDVVVGFDDDITLGAVQAIEEAGLTGKIEVYSITGQSEAFEAIRNGSMVMTVQNRTSDITAKLAEVIKAYIAGEKIDYNQPTEVNFISAENVDKFEPEF